MWNDLDGLPITTEREQSLQGFFLEKKTVELSIKMTTEIMERLDKEINDRGIDKSIFTNNTLDEFIDFLLSPENPKQHEEMNIIKEFSLWICSISAAPPAPMALSASCAVFFMARGETDKAACFYMPLLSIALSHVEMKESYIRAGKKGGRPENPRKKEALEIARQKWEQADYLSVSSVATAVKHQLEKKYTDAPSLPAIKKWISAAGIKKTK